MPTYVTPEGLQIPTVESLIADTTTLLRLEVDPNLDTGPDDPMGQLVAITMSHLREAYEVIQVGWHGRDPNQAEDSQLDATCAITGTKRENAIPSRFRGTRRVVVNLDAGTTLPIGRVAHVSGQPTIRFVTTEEIGPVPSAGNYLVTMESEEAGPVPCNANTLTVIATAVAGWNSVNNPFDAELGKVQEQDPALRERREGELARGGANAVDAIRADLLSYEDEDTGENPIEDAWVLENDTNATNGDGLPAHSIEVIVFDGISASLDNDTIAQVIWGSKPGGTTLVGSESGTATDSEGNSRTVAFSRPDILEVIMGVDVTLIDTSEDPADYQDQINAAIIAEFTKRVRRAFVIRHTHYEAAVVAIPGVDTVAITLGFAPGPLQPYGTDLTLGIREMAFVQSSGISVS